MVIAGRPRVTLILALNFCRFPAVRGGLEKAVVIDEGSFLWPLNRYQFISKGYLLLSPVMISRILKSLLCREWKCILALSYPRSFTSRLN